VTDIAAPEGEVISSADPIQITFSISDVWKGQVSETFVLTTPRDSASCGYSFTLGADYLVYAYEGENGLETNLCSRTTRLAADLEDLTTLGESTVPAASEPAPSSISGPSTYLWLSVAGVVVLGLVAVGLLLNRWNN
jgi:hypothetical protein